MQVRSAETFAEICNVDLGFVAVMLPCLRDKSDDEVVSDLLTIAPTVSALGPSVCIEVVKALHESGQRDQVVSTLLQMSGNKDHQPAEQSREAQAQDSLHDDDIETVQPAASAKPSGGGLLSWIWPRRQPERGSEKLKALAADQMPVQSHQPRDDVQSSAMTIELAEGATTDEALVGGATTSGLSGVEVVGESHMTASDFKQVEEEVVHTPFAPCEGEDEDFKRLLHDFVKAARDE